MLSARQRKLCKRLEADRGRLFRMAYAWTSNADIADEVVQVTMIKAMHSIDKLNDIDLLDSWLFRILSNCFIDLCRKRRDEVDIDDVVLFTQETPEAVHSQDEMLAAVRSAIACLPVNHRQVITLVDIEGFSYTEVSSILGVPLGTIMNRLNRARQSLKIILNEQQKEDSDKFNITSINKFKLKIIQ